MAVNAKFSSSTTKIHLKPFKTSLVYAILTKLPYGDTVVNGVKSFLRIDKNYNFKEAIVDVDYQLFMALINKVSVLLSKFIQKLRSQSE